MEIPASQLSMLFDTLKLQLDQEKEKNRILLYSIAEMFDIDEESLKTLPLISIIEEMSKKLDKPVPKVIINIITQEHL